MPAPTGVTFPAPAGPTDFTEWARPSLLAMTRFARRLAPDADVDDLVQDALTQAWRKRSHFDPARGSATSWLLAIVADRARTARRSRTRRLKLIDEDAELPDGQLRDALPDTDLDAAIAKLPPRQRAAVHLHYFVGLPLHETAEVLQCSTGTVKSNLHDARTKLRTLLGDDHAH